MTVLNFKKPEKPEPQVYVCNCGCENFWLYADGQVECAECNMFHPDMTGYWKTIDPDAPLGYRVKQPDGSYVLEEKSDERTGKSPESDARVQDWVSPQRLEEGTQSDEP